MRAWLIILFALGGVAPAEAADLKLLTAGAFKSVALELVPEFQRKSGHRVTVDNDTAGGLARRIANGEHFDVVVLTPGTLGPLLGNRVVEGSVKPLARVGIGVGIKQGAAAPDISSLDAWKQSLLAARSIAYVDPASGGTSGIYLARLLEKLGIAEQLRPKTVLVRGGRVAETVASGEAEIGMQQASEILGVPGARLVGPIPLEVQSYTIYAGAVSASTRSYAAAGALLMALHGPDKAALLKRKGMEVP